MNTLNNGDSYLQLHWGQLTFSQRHLGVFRCHHCGCYRPSPAVFKGYFCISEFKHQVLWSNEWVERALRALLLLCVRIACAVQTLGMYGTFLVTITTIKRPPQKNKNHPEFIGVRGVQQHPHRFYTP